MFGFGNRKKYNGSVDTKLNREYQISTRGNPRFPSFSQYLEILEKTFNSGLSEDDAALYIAILYYAVMLEGHMHEEADIVLSRIKNVGAYNMKIGVISQERWDRFYTYIEEAQVKFIHDNSSMGIVENEDIDTPESRLEKGLSEIKTLFGFDMNDFSGRKDFEDYYYQAVRNARISSATSYALIMKLVALFVLADGHNRRMAGIPVAKGDLSWTLDLLERSEKLASEGSADGNEINILLPKLADDFNYLLSYFGFK
ncbi:TPA: hypothetical protein ACP32N_003256 [Pseudomonas aeruginosa]